MRNLADKPSLYIVLVLYKTELSESPSYLTLLQACSAVAGRLRVSLLVYDNSPELGRIGPRSAEMSAVIPMAVHHDPDNGGLVAAYNCALKQAAHEECEWLLLLDQDTQLPVDYLESFLAAYPWFDSQIACAVPRVRVNGKVREPRYSGLFHRSRFVVDPLTRGAMVEEISSINSASFVSVAYLNRKGGYPTTYRLDAVDFWFFAELYRSGMRAWVLDSVVDHDLSTMNIADVSLGRWRSITAAATDFEIHMRRRGSRAAASLGGLLNAAILLAGNSKEHARVQLNETLRLLRSLRG